MLNAIKNWDDKRLLETYEAHMEQLMDMRAQYNSEMYAFGDAPVGSAGALYDQQAYCDDLKFEIDKRGLFK